MYSLSTRRSLGHVKSRGRIALLVINRQCNSLTFQRTLLPDKPFRLANVSKSPGWLDDFSSKRGKENINKRDLREFRFSVIEIRRRCFYRVCFLFLFRFLFLLLFQFLSSFSVSLQKLLGTA